MPIYEYECNECGEHVEHLQLSSDSPLTECEKCGGPLRKLMSAPAFQFKGTGWYVTDYADKSKSSAGGGDSKGAGSGKSAGDGGSKDSAKSGDSGGAKSDSASSSKVKSSSPAD